MTAKERNFRRIGKQKKLLPCKLTEQELLAYGSDLGAVVQDIGTEEDRQASLKQELKARLSLLESKRSELASKITRKEEYREIEVESELDFDANQYREVRLDTGEVVKSRPLTEDERQESLELKG